METSQYKEVNGTEPFPSARLPCQKLQPCKVFIAMATGLVSLLDTPTKVEKGVELVSTL